MKKYFILFVTFFTLSTHADRNSIRTEKGSRCHVAPSFSQYSPTQWAAQVDRMAPNAGLNDKEIQMLKDLNQ